MARKHSTESCIATPSKRQRRKLCALGDQQRPTQHISESEGPGESTSATPSRPAKSELPATSFLDLPRELRDRVYHEIWIHKPAFELALPLGRDRHRDEGTLFRRSEDYLQIHSSEPGYHIFNVRYGSDDSLARLGFPHNKHPPWLFTNKQTCVEAVEQFQRNAIWTYGGIARSGHEHRHLGSWKNTAVPRRKSRLGASLLLPSTAYTMHFFRREPIRMLSSSELSSTGKPVMRTNFWEDNDLLQRLAASFAITSSLRTLFLFLEVRAIEHDSYSLHTPAVIDIRPLLDLDMPNLRVLQIDVSYHSLCCPGEKKGCICRRIHAHAGLKQKFVEALSKTGLRMIGEGGIEASRMMDEAQTSTHRFTRA